MWCEGRSLVVNADTSHPAKWNKLEIGQKDVEFLNHDMTILRTHNFSQLNLFPPFFSYSACDSIHFLKKLSPLHADYFSTHSPRHTLLIQADKPATALTIINLIYSI